MTACDLVSSDDVPNSWVLIKHDVETQVAKTVRIAEIEAEHGIKATYYVHAYLVADHKQELVRIAEMGHEVSYHYDVLDANNGAMGLAAMEFQRSIDEFAEIGLAVKTVCPHGNPVLQRKGWSSNKDFFRAQIFSTL